MGERLARLKPSVSMLNLATAKPAQQAPTYRMRGRRLQERRDRHTKLKPLCVKCEERGIVRAWTQLDHVVPLFKGGADDDSNLQGLCDDCHAAKTKQDLAGGLEGVSP